MDEGAGVIGIGPEHWLTPPLTQGFHYEEPNALHPWHVHVAYIDLIEPACWVAWTVQPEPWFRGPFRYEFRHCVEREMKCRLELFRRNK